MPCLRRKPARSGFILVIAFSKYLHTLLIDSNRPSHWRNSPWALSQMGSSRGVTIVSLQLDGMASCAERQYLQTPYTSRSPLVLVFYTQPSCCGEQKFAYLKISSTVRALLGTLCGPVLRRYAGSWQRSSPKASTLVVPVAP